MKLKIVENRYLLEDIAAVKKYYPSIDDATFMQLIALDPTYRDGSNSLGKYGKWILNLYNKGAISEEDFSEISPLLQQFTTYRNRIQNKDLNSYKSLQELSDILAAVVEDDSMLSPRQKVRFLKNVKAGRVNIAAEDDYEIVLDTPKYVVYVPNTHEASMKLGKGTKWCTAHENPEWYNGYTENNYKLYIIADKHNGELYQYSQKTDDILDKNDAEFNWKSVFGNDKDLLAFLNDVSFGFFPKSLPVVRNGVAYTERYNYLTKEQKKKTIKIVIPDGCTEIQPRAFYHAEKIESIEIPNGVIYIQPDAFQGCYHLGDDIGDGTVVIPDTVKYIGAGAFIDCYSIDHIKIPQKVEFIDSATFKDCNSLIWVELPDGIKSIRDYAFESCFDLTSINIPNSVNFIGRDVFYECDKLIVYTNSEYVKQYCADNNIEVKPASEYMTESFRHGIKLRIAEK